MYLFHCWWYDVTKVTKLQMVGYLHRFRAIFFSLKITLLRTSACLQQIPGLLQLHRSHLISNGNYILSFKLEEQVSFLGELLL